MIEVNNLTFSYSKKNPFIENMSFTIKKGEIFGLLGPSGAGKSTVQKILTGIIRNYQGSVKVIEEEAKTITNDFYNNLGVQFEVPNLYSKYSALENLQYFGSLYNSQCLNNIDLLKMVDLENDKDKLVKDFSKGMKTRLNFIRAIKHQPQILFLDEPTSGLDPINARKIKEIIKSFSNQGITIILTTHNMHDVEELCNRVAFINNGKILAIDEVEKLIRKSNENQVTFTYTHNNKQETKTTLLKDLNMVEFLRIVVEKRLLSIHSKETNLNDLFIKLAGRNLDESD